MTGGSASPLDPPSLGPHADSREGGSGGEALPPTVYVWAATYRQAQLAQGSQVHKTGAKAAFLAYPRAQGTSSSLRPSPQVPHHIPKCPIHVPKSPRPCSPSPPHVLKSPASRTQDVPHTGRWKGHECQCNSGKGRANTGPPAPLLA